MHKHISRIAVSALSSVIFITICSKCSFLYPMNDWVDINCFFTVGRSICSGSVPYADIYDQKGPLLYLPFAAVSLISKNSFVGIYLLEIAAFFLFLIFSASCASLFVKSEKMICAITVILAAVTASSWAFSHGGSAEELSLFMIPLSLYIVLREIKSGRTLSAAHSAVIGALAATALWIKFTICGFFLGLGIFVLIWYFKQKEPFGIFFRTVGGFFLGFSAVSAAVLAYFISRHALPDLIEGYFYNNLFLYSKGSGNILALAANILYGLAVSTVNAGWMIPLIAGAAHHMRNAGKHRPESLAILLSLGCLAALTYIGGQHYRYYALILSPYAVFGFAYMAELFESGKIKLPKTRTAKAAEGILCAAAVVLSAAAYVRFGNVYLMKYSKDDLPQYKFAKIIAEKEDSTMLNFGFLDGGFYFAAEKLPVNKYFCKLNIDDEVFPVMMNEQMHIAEEGLVDFIVTQNEKLEEYGEVEEYGAVKYTCVSYAEYFNEGKTVRYYLYELNDSAE